MLKSLSLTTAFLCFLHAFIIGQVNSELTSAVIFESSPNDMERISNELTTKVKDVSIRKISNNFDFYLATSAIDIKMLNTLVVGIKGVSSVTNDDVVELRSKPNDPRINEQYAHSFIKSFEAWDVTTGGKDGKGRDVVIAVIDDGFQINHEDIKPNLWINTSEIPNDGIDNDNNGYKDDINGWNAKTNKGLLDISSHGTYVAGAAGAKGNNEKGIAGVAWDAKLMLLVTGGTVSTVIESYDYVLTQKKLWNSSGGSKGANIVVTSYSGGISFAKAEDYPAWCVMFDKLGLEGILSVTATTNAKDNVDVVGDMPSTCASSFLIVVNSSNELDELESVTGFGPKSVDISAPGESILTTDKNITNYKLESGTSLATPIVAGAIALMYSIPCKAIAEAADADPSDLAAKVKIALMSSVDQKQSMKGLTVTGGRLNIIQAFVELQKEYKDCDVVILPATKFKILDIRSVSQSLFRANYESPSIAEKSYFISDVSGRVLLHGKFSSQLVGSFNFEINDLVSGAYSLTVVDEGKNVSFGFGIVRN